MRAVAQLLLLMQLVETSINKSVGKVNAYSVIVMNL